MLTTNELQKYIMSEINDKLDEISYSNVFFEKGDDNSAEGTYIFSTNSNYHILYAEKGKIRSDIVVNDKTRNQRIRIFAAVRGNGKSRGTDHH